MVKRPDLNPHPPKRLFAFTLVELLVVIGIIALLISILLPSLNKARKMAKTIKCASNLRQIGNAYQMYATDNSGWFPPAKLAPLSSNAAGAGTYSLPKLNYVANSAQPYWWYNFISKYLSTYNFGTYGMTSDSAQAQQSVLWGCPEWSGYSGAAGGNNGVTATSGGVAASQPGYGVNEWPLMNADTPGISASAPFGTLQPTDVEGWVSGSKGTTQGQFWPANTYSHASDRALMADSIFWVCLSEYISSTDTPTCVPAFLTNNASTPTQSEGQTWADFYRHGDYPKVLTTGGGRGVTTSVSYDPGGGKVAYNILYCDGHVITSHSKTDAFKAFRMRYPG